MKTTSSVPEMLHIMLLEEMKRSNSVEVLYLRQDEYDFFQAWAKAHGFSRVHYYDPQLQYKVMIQWDGKILN